MQRMAGRQQFALSFILLAWILIWVYTVNSMYYTDTYITTKNNRKIKPQFLHSTLHTQELKPGTAHAIQTAYLALDSYMQQDVQSVEYPVLSANACFNVEDNTKNCHPLPIHSAAICPSGKQVVSRESETWEVMRTYRNDKALGYGKETTDDGKFYIISSGMQRVCQHERIGEMRILHSNVGTYGFAGTRDLRVELYGIASLVVLMLLAEIVRSDMVNDHAPMLYANPVALCTALFCLQMLLLFLKPYYADEEHHDIIAEGALVQEHTLIGTASVFYVSIVLSLTWVWLVVGKTFRFAEYEGTYSWEKLMESGKKYGRNVLESVASRNGNKGVGNADKDANGQLDFNTDYLFAKSKRTDAYAPMRFADKTSVYKQVHEDELSRAQFDKLLFNVQEKGLGKSRPDMAETVLTTSLLVLTFMLPQAYTRDIQFQYKFILCLSVAIIAFAYRRACKLVRITFILIDAGDPERSEDSQAEKNETEASDHVSLLKGTTQGEQSHQLRTPLRVFKVLICLVFIYLWVIIYLELTKTSRSQAYTHVTTSDTADHDGKRPVAVFVILWIVYGLSFFMREYKITAFIDRHFIEFWSVFVLVWLASIVWFLNEDERSWISIIKYFETDSKGENAMTAQDTHSLMQLIWKFQEPVLS